MSWEIFKLKDITVNLDNKRKPLNESERSKISKKQLYPYLGANNIMGYVDEYLFDEEIICIAEDGGSWGENQKCCVFINEKCWVNNHAHVLKSNGKADLKYLMYYLNAKDLNSYITGSTRGKLTKSSLDSIQIPLPPLATQKRIAEILDAADALRRKDQELLKKYDELAQAIFIDMFGDPVKNQKGWKKEVLGDLILTSPKNGFFMKNSDYSEKGTPIVWISDFIDKPTIEMNNLKRVNATNEEINKHQLKYGDVLFCRSSLTKEGIGKCSIVPRNIDKTILYECHIIKVELPINLTPEYFRVLSDTSFFRNQIMTRSKTSTMTTIGQDGIISSIIPVPPIKLQEKFSDLFYEIEKCKANIKKIKVESENNFKAIMSECFL